MPVSHDISGTSPAAISPQNLTPFAHDKSVLSFGLIRKNGSDLARDFGAALQKTTTQVCLEDATVFPLYKLFKPGEGFNLDYWVGKDDSRANGTDKAFNGRTQAFNIDPAEWNDSVTKERLEGLRTYWQENLKTLRADVQAEFRAAQIENATFAKMIRVLDGLQKVLDEGITPLIQTFEKYPDVQSIDLKAVR